MEMLWLELREPILTWRPGQTLELPTPGRASTLVLHDVNELTANEQRRMLEWLDQTAWPHSRGQHDENVAVAAAEIGRLPRRVVLPAEYRLRRHRDVAAHGRFLSHHSI
jgi:hypothetical protein